MRYRAIRRSTYKKGPTVKNREATGAPSLRLV